MKQNYTASGIFSWLGTYLALQLFITLISLPILVNWGLPLSLMALLGNLLFSPLLMVVLFLSSLIFFTQLCYLPNQFLITALEYVCSLWQKLTGIANHGWLMSFALPSPVILGLLFASTCAILLYKKIRTPWKLATSFGALLFIFWAYNYAFCRPNKDFIAHIPCHAGTITLVHTQNSYLLIDSGHIGSRIHSPSWVEYTLIPYLRKNYGVEYIGHVVITKPGKITFDAVEKLCSFMKIGHVHCVYWHGETPRYLARSYINLRRTCAKHNVELHRFGYTPYTIDITETQYLHITPSTYSVRYKAATYPHVEYVLSTNLN